MCGWEEGKKTVVNVMHEHSGERDAWTQGAEKMYHRHLYCKNTFCFHQCQHTYTASCMFTMCCFFFFFFTIFFLLVPFTAENHIHVFVSTNLMLSSCSQLLFNACPKTCLGFLCAILLFKLDVFLEEKLGVLQRESTLKELPAKRRDKRS